MDQKRNKLPLKLIFGIVAMFIAFAFSLAITGTTSAQQAATDTPTATEMITSTPGATDTPIATATPAAGQTQTSPTSTPAAGGSTSPSATPATGATSTPAPSGTSGTGTVPVTGASNARSLAITKIADSMSNMSDSNLEAKFNELMSKARNQTREVNASSHKIDRDDQRLGIAATNNNNNNNNGHPSNSVREMREDIGVLNTDVGFARSLVLAAQNMLNAHAGFDANGNVTNRQAAINTIAVAQFDLSRSAASIRAINNDLDLSDNSERSERNVNK